MLCGRCIARGKGDTVTQIKRKIKECYIIDPFYGRKFRFGYIVAVL